ncbi:hypothetical protein ACIGXM_11185 [Kitasatospora sp. NPDC052896]|uniref:hypothetical protein n=1 Tax=Kitasatospora sp. NPDC052896 TaxID=3364061 RepID=UPI0037CBCA06
MSDVPAKVPSTGTFVVDMKTRRTMIVMDFRDGKLYIRPPAGGIEWQRGPDEVRPADRSEVLRARVARINAADRATVHGPATGPKHDPGRARPE